MFSMGKTKPDMRIEGWVIPSGDGACIYAFIPLSSLKNINLSSKTSSVIRNIGTI